MKPAGSEIAASISLRWRRHRNECVGASRIEEGALFTDSLRTCERSKSETPG